MPNKLFPKEEKSPNENNKPSRINLGWLYGQGIVLLSMFWLLGKFFNGLHFLGPLSHKFLGWFLAIEFWLAIIGVAMGAILSLKIFIKYLKAKTISKEEKYQIYLILFWCIFGTYLIITLTTMCYVFLII